MSGKSSRENTDDGGNNNSRCMASKIVTVACALVSAVALLGHDDGNEKTTIVSKVVIATSAAMAANILVSRLFTLFSSTCSVSKTTEDDSNGTWSFPPDGWIKCNVDGSAPQDKASGCGGVFRDSNGNWLYGFAKSFDNCTSSAAELTAISTALDIARVRGFRKLVLETDSLTVADVVNNKNGASASRTYEKELVESINRKKNRTIEIVHCNREGNKVAHWLANLSHGLRVGDQIELSELPKGCQSCRDLMNEDTRVAKTKGRPYPLSW